MVGVLQRPDPVAELQRGLGVAAGRRGPDSPRRRARIFRRRGRFRSPGRPGDSRRQRAPGRVEPEHAVGAERAAWRERQRRGDALVA